MKKLKYSWKEINIKSKIFYICTAIALVITAVCGLMSNGDMIKNVLFNHEDVFMDFFNSVNNCGGDAYGEYGVIYPPFVVLMYRIISYMFVPALSSLAMRETSLGMIIFIVYTIACVFLLAKCEAKYKIGNKLDKILLIFLLLTSLPMIFLLERGNILILVISLLMIYVFGYDSQKTYVRHIAFICLAIAVAIKIYPVVFGLLLLRKKNFNIKNILWCVLYGGLFFFVPFLFVGGLSQLPVLINNIFYTSSMFGGNGFGYKVNITNTFAFIGALLNRPYVFETIGNAAMIISGVVGVLLMIFGKFRAKWQLVAIPCLFIIMIPGFSYIYCITYMIIALVMFLNEKTKSKIDYLYLILFILQFAMIPAQNASFTQLLITSEQKLNISTVVESIALLVMVVLIYVETIINTLVYTKGKKLGKTPIPLMPILSVCLAGFIVLSGMFSIPYSAKKSGFSITKMDLWTVDDEDKDSQEELNSLYKFASNNMNGKSVLAFPKVAVTTELEKYSKTTYYDTSYYDTSLKTMKKVKAENADYVVIYNVPKYDVEQTNKSYSKSEFDKYYKMNNDINKYVLNTKYAKIKTYNVNDDYSIVIWQKSNKDYKWYDSGEGTRENPYTMSTPEELVAFSEYVNAGNSLNKKFVKLTNDIDMSAYDNFVPIGYERYGNVFKGTFDGNGYAIKNLTIKQKNSPLNSMRYNVALFGKLAGAVVNLKIIDSHFSGYCIASVARSANNESAKVINCYSSNNTFDGYRCGEIVDDFAGWVYSCVGLNNDIDSDTNYGLVGYSKTAIQVTGCFTNTFFDNDAAAYLEAASINSQNIAGSLNYCAYRYNCAMKLRYLNAQHFNIRAGKDEKKKLIDKRVPLCQWVIENSELTLTHNK